MQHDTKIFGPRVLDDNTLGYHGCWWQVCGNRLDKSHSFNRFHLCPMVFDVWQIGTHVVHGKMLQHVRIQIDKNEDRIRCEILLASCWYHVITTKETSVNLLQMFAGQISHAEYPMCFGFERLTSQSVLFKMCWSDIPLSARTWVWWLLIVNDPLSNDIILSITLW